MSSAANDKRGKLEEEFSNRMYDAEASPSQDLWARIDHELTVQENGEYKKRAAFYRQLAAACIVLLLLAGGLSAWYLGSPDGTGQPLAIVAPAGNPGPANSLSSGTTEEATLQPAVAATTKGQEQNKNTVPVQDKAGANLKETSTAASVTIAAASNTRPSEKEGGVTASTALPLSATGSVPAAAEAEKALSLAAAETPEVVESGKLVSLSRPLSQTIATLSVIEQKADNKATLLQQSVAAKGTEAKATDDFKKLNEQVMAHAKKMEEEQKAKLLAFNKEAEGKEGTKKDKGEGDSRWSLGMAYAPGYFEQNVGISNQMMGGAYDYSMRLSSSNAASISSLYMEEAREEYAENTDPGFSYGFEAKTGFKLGKKLRLLAGLGFLQNTARSSSSFIVHQYSGHSFAGGSGEPSTVFIPSLTSERATDSLLIAKTPEYKVNHRYRYLTVPVGLQYEGNMGKDWFWYGGAGVAANILMQATILASSSEVQDVTYDLGDDSPFRKLQWSGRVSGGVGKRLAGNMSVTVGPEFRSYFSTLLAEPEDARAQQGRPYAVGLNMALNYDLSGNRKSK